MPFIDEFIQGKVKSSETFSHTIGKMGVISLELAKSKFSSVTLNEDSENITYFEFKLCNSFPKFNARGRGFTPKVLDHSFASLNDQLIDMEHCLVANGIGKNDRIIGCVKATHFAIPKEAEEIANDPRRIAIELANMQPIPVDALGVLFNRAKGVREAIDNHISKREKWAVSMECGHRWDEAQFFYRGEFIPAIDAELAMRDCVGPTSIKDFKGHPLRALLGGMDKEVDFWGVGFTKDPADKDADVYSFMGNQPKELASRHTFFMPLQSFSAQAVEVASEGADTKISEVASIEVIGQTDPEESDGHAHDILSNMMVMPTQGHHHDIQAFSINPGATPTVTGHTSVHNQYGYSDVSSGKKPTHSHTINISLKRKYTSSGKDSAPPSEEVASMNEELRKLLEAQGKLLAKLGESADIAAMKAVVGEIASSQAKIQSELAKVGTEQERDAYVAGLVKDGKYLTKEMADAAVATAVEAKEKELNEKAEAAQKEADLKLARVTKCGELNIDLKTELEGVKKADGSAMTLQDRLDSIPLNDEGQKQFDIDSQIWAAATKPVEAAAAPAPTMTPAAEAANKGKTIPAKPAPRKIPAIAGGGPSEELADKGTNKGAARPSHLRGRSRIS